EPLNTHASSGAAETPCRLAGGTRSAPACAAGQPAWRAEPAQRLFARSAPACAAGKTYCG
ncbi:hypothetical protein, partial [Pantoea vagans]|uniref:hypothetical protein n=1 Tax=Pantoea vagans TaxID=470934 RepID=UPI0019553B25